MKLISIIIRTKNEEKWIGHCLEAISKQTYQNYEVVLVDNCSSDKTVDKAIKYSFVSKVINIGDFYPGKAINDGVRASAGEIIVVLSGHCIPKNEVWLSNLIAELDNHSIAGVYGRQEPMSFSSPFDKRDLAIVFGLDKKIQVKDPFFHNANSAFLKSIWEEFPFDESVTNIEDRLWGASVLKAGYKLCYVPNASVFHYHGIHHGRNIERVRNTVKVMNEFDQDCSDQNSFNESLNPNMVAIIPIKGESIYFEGICLLERAVNYLRRNKLVRNIYVSCDSVTTANLANRFGVKVIVRPSFLSLSHVDLEQVIQFTLCKIEEAEDIPDLVAVIEETYPFRDEGLIDKMALHLIRENLDTVIAAKEELRFVVDFHNPEQSSELNFMPRLLKDSKKNIGLLGAGFVTRPELIRSGSLLASRLGVFNLENPLSTIEVRSDKDVAVLRHQLRFLDN